MQAGADMQPGPYEPHMQHEMQASDMAGQKRKHPDDGFAGPADAPQADGFASSPTVRNAPPAHDVFRMRRKQRTKMAEG